MIKTCPLCKKQGNLKACETEYACWDCGVSYVPRESRIARTTCGCGRTATFDRAEHEYPNGWSLVEHKSASDVKPIITFDDPPGYTQVIDIPYSLICPACADGGNL